MYCPKNDSLSAHNRPAIYPPRPPLPLYDGRNFLTLLVPSPLTSRCVQLASSSPAGWLLRVKAIPAAVVVLDYYQGRALVHLCISRTYYHGSLMGHSWYT